MRLAVGFLKSSDTVTSSSSIKAAESKHTMNHKSIHIHGNTASAVIGFIDLQFILLYYYCPLLFSGVITSFVSEINM